ncbi:group I truncated hemoglobin [Actinomadura scrupuli]|uniref:group I truncated hemoglobin n=1 Tax=Actinomadura scrupuli TaxID=559629 RepID=UPI003D972DC2
MSVHDSVGGSRVIRTAVEVFYRRLLADPGFMAYFDGVDVTRLAAHQRAFLTAALGGPDLYGGRDLAAAHRGLRIDDAAFDAVAEHLVTALRDLGVEAGVLRLITDRIETFRDDVVEAPA